MEQQLSLRRLEIFCLVVETGAVTRAAEQLMIAQPAVSSQIKSLERWFGAPLFTRTAGRLQLTEAGDRAYGWARETLARSVRVQRDVQEIAAGGAGRVVVTSSMAVGTYLLPPALSRVRVEREGADITLHVAQPEHAIHAVEAGEADFAVTTWHDHAVPATLSYEHLGDQPLVLCAAPEGPPATDTIELHDLPRLPFVSVPANVAFHRTIEAQMQQLGVGDLHVVIRLGHAESMRQAVIDQRWVALLPQYCVATDLHRGRLRAIEVTGLDIREQIVLVQRRDRYFSPLQLAVRSSLVEAVASRTSGPSCSVRQPIP